MATYNITYGKQDFFYNSMDQNGLGVIDTFPFDVDSVITWARNVTENQEDFAYTPIDIFDVSLASVIMNSTYDFGNSFLKGNMVFNNTFNPSTVDTTSRGGSTGGLYTPDSSNPKPTMGGLPYVSGVVNPDGGTSNVIGIAKNQRCNFRPVCTIKHLHYSCTTQNVTNNGRSDCNCLCTGPPVLDDSPHSHCTTFTNDIEDPKAAVYSAYTQKSGLAAWASSTTTSTNSSTTYSDPNFIVPYANYTDLSNNDGLLRQLICNYYEEVYQNKQYMQTLSAQIDTYATNNKATIDSTVNYKTNYLNLFNIVSGIFIVSGYIYVMAKEQF
jgi:hypothetical protein